MFDVPPRRLSTDRKSLFYDICYKRVKVKLNGIEMPGNVHEYDMDAGWADVRVRRADGRFRLDASGNYVLERHFGEIEPRFVEKISEPAFTITPVTAPHDDIAAQQKAADKQARKAAKRLALAERNALR